ncbi:hypothetical protein [Streptomyces sp. NPDC096339]|uniref:hypothetical protein n=1 Tax=Streptomyces sp. NPDC096339 TaxID=3366086 RepID=UPI00380C123D
MSFEDQLGEALRRAGDGFTTDRHALVEAGERRGRRLVARRRAAVIGGSVLSLALIGGVGAYAGGVLDGKGRGEVAAPATPSDGPSGVSSSPFPPPPPAGAGTYSSAQLAEVFRGLLPGGTLSVDHMSGPDSMGTRVTGVYDDGKGKAGVELYLGRDAPVLTYGCPNEPQVEENAGCTTERLADGSSLEILRSHTVSDLGVETKQWRATLRTPQRFTVSITEWNKQSESDAAITRPTPPLNQAQLKALVTSDKWHPALKDLPESYYERTRREAGISN